jgi:hypothetical protein
VGRSARQDRIATETEPDRACRYGPWLISRWKPQHRGQECCRSSRMLQKLSEAFSREGMCRGAVPPQLRRSTSALPAIGWACRSKCRRRARAIGDSVTRPDWLPSCARWPRMKHPARQPDDPPPRYARGSARTACRATARLCRFSIVVANMPAEEESKRAVEGAAAWSPHQ